MQEVSRSTSAWAGRVVLARLTLLGCQALLIAVLGQDNDSLHVEDRLWCVPVRVVLSCTYKRKKEKEVLRGKSYSKLEK